MRIPNMLHCETKIPRLQKLQGTKVPWVQKFQGATVPWNESSYSTKVLRSESTREIFREQKLSIGTFHS